MKIALPNDSKQGMGGGWTFKRNLEKGLRKLGQDIIEDFRQADIALITGTSMVTKETVQAIKDAHTKLVVRLDNVPRNSRNRNTGTSRLQSFSKQADEVVWQSQWAREYLGDFIGREGVLIYNGVDQDIFKKDGATLDFHTNRDNIYLYSRFNRDETKNWEVAWYEFQMIVKKNPDAKLVIVGKFSPEQMEYNFDFFRGEKIEYLGIVEDPIRMAQIMRSCKNFLATYYNDCFSNTYLEALACGMFLWNVNLSGGTPEMMDLFSSKGLEYFTIDRMAKDYLALFEKVLS